MNMQKSVVADLIEAAIEWAEAGVPVFPTGEDKRPLTENGFYDASTDPDAITAMFKAAGNRLHGIGGRMGAEAGLFAIDADTYKEGDAGAAAKAYVADLERAGLLPQTRVHATRNGGRHYLFRAKEFPNCKPSKGVEVKGEGGYIVLPPSPGYTIEREGLASAPVALVESLKAARAAQSATTLDVLRQNVLSGDDFHDSLTQIAAKMSAGGEPLVRVQAAVMELMQASVAANPQHPRHDRWQPIMADKSGELTRIVSSGHAKYNVAAKTDGLREAATDTIKQMAASMFPAVRNEMAQLPIVRADAYGDDFPFANKRGYFGFEELDVLTEEFIMHPIYHASEVTLISADPKAGKTLVSQTLAMHIAAGLNFDDNLTVTERRPVLYFALESQTAIKKRLVAWRKYHDPAGDLYTDHNNFPFFTVEESLNLLDETSRINLVEQIKATEVWWQKRGEKSLGVIVIDTLTKAMPGGDQNSVEDTSAVFDIIAKIRDSGVKAAIVIIHHNTKNGNQPRGSSNIQAEPDTLLTLTRNQETDQLELRILMARSIDDDKVFTFDIVTETLGVSNQGYTITAPVLLPGVRIVPEGEDEAVVALRTEMTYKPLFDAVAGLGTGSWSVRTVHDHLKEKMAGTGLYDRQMALRSNAVDLSAFYANIFPPNGRNTDGGYNITIETGPNRSGLPLVRFFHVRRFAS
jgi:hypothetical protein